jgi:hypothetical protein
MRLRVDTRSSRTCETLAGLHVLMLLSLYKGKASALSGASWILMVGLHAAYSRHRAQPSDPPEDVDGSKARHTN